MKNKIELAHYYINENLNSDQIFNDILKVKNALLNIKKEINIYYIFIDDYTYQEKKIDIDLILNMYKKELGLSIQIVYESDMKKYFTNFIFLLKNNIEIKTYKNNIKLSYQINNKENFLCSIFPELKISCLSLSTMWSLYRLGFWNSENNIIYTIIDKKYKKLEKMF
jgi:hypothetical protein